MVMRVGDWYVDYRVDIAYKILNSEENNKYLVRVYDKKTGKLSTELLNSDMVKDIRKGAE